MKPMPDDLHQIEKLFHKSIHSYKGFIPSTDFDEHEYSLYLQYASAEELENDILSEKTYLKMVYEGNWDGEPPDFSLARIENEELRAKEQEVMELAIRLTKAQRELEEIKGQ